MSLATLARKTRTKQRLRTRGKFILNMTGRGNVLGMSAKMSRGCNGFTNCAGKRVSCCAGVGEPDCCSFPHGGKPSKQMGYGVYLNRKSKGAYHPGGGPQCCTKPNATSGKIVWKQGPSISASEIIQQRKDRLIACWRETNNSSLTGMTKFTQLYKYEMNVGNYDNEYGFDNTGSGANDRFGELCPNKQVLGSNTILGLQFKGNSNIFKFSVFSTPGEEPKRCDIKNIYLVDKDSQRYIKKYSIKNIYKFEETAVFKWKWKDDINYWKHRVGKCLDVIIEVEKTSEKTKPCAVKTISCGNNISGRNATDLVSYTRINHVSCGTTKTLPFSSSCDQIAFRRTTSGCPKLGLASFKRPMNTLQTETIKI